jgi:uncharacterized protein (TIGR02147 family)
MREQLAIQRILQSRFAGLRAKNPAYSIRAFSKRVGISAGTLSLILLGKRSISKKLADKISRNLMLDPQERAEVLDQFPQSRKAATRAQDSVDPSYLQLSADQFHVVSDWYYFAILNLIEIEGFQNDSAWIAGRLGLPVSTIQAALERLNRLEMIQEDAQGKLTRVAPRYRTTDDVANLSLRKSHHQTLDLAKESLDRDSVDIRDFTWLVLPMDTRKLTEAKTLIRKFQDDLLETLGQNARPDEVYRLGIQLFPMTRVKGNSK